ncbi:MAG: choice-of-anchor V domain-containing protein, partial [Candidatus Thermoplasmatota archaeon]|nr:choice-of-anchor V domain-containing protein [Candidatus Thermoplasmatota archaeon]
MSRSGQIGEEVMKSRTLLILLLSVCLLAPVVANPNGPPWVNPINNGLTVETGCTCHGNGVPSNDVVVSISGVPRAYAVGESYEFTINLQHASYANGGFLLTDYGVGTFTAGEGSQIVTESDGSEPGAVSQTAPSNDWIVTWTAPASDVGEISFSLAGNAVDGQAGANEGDNWNLLSFFISSPESMTNDDEENQPLRTISVGDFESLFVAVENPEALEAERQAEIADDFFTNGNLFYWSTLAIILIGAVV